MLTACETDIAELTKEIEEFRHMDETVKQRKKDMKKSIDLLDDILQDGHISDTHLRMLVEKVRIFQIDVKLRGVIALNGTFRAHLDFYDENGEMIGGRQSCGMSKCRRGIGGRWGTRTYDGRRIRESP